MKTRTFKSVIEGKDVTLCVRSPSVADQREATKSYNQTFSEALKAKAIVRAKLDDLLVDQGLWDDRKQLEFSTLQSLILEGERTLAKGGISLASAKEIALKMRKDRAELRDLISVKTNLDTHTAEGQADNARFNYLVSVTITNKGIYDNIEDAINNLIEFMGNTLLNNLENINIEYAINDNIIYILITTGQETKIKTSLINSSIIVVFIHYLCSFQIII
jgi:hypothetical protein